MFLVEPLVPRGQPPDPHSLLHVSIVHYSVAWHGVVGNHGHGVEPEDDCAERLADAVEKVKKFLASVDGGQALRRSNLVMQLTGPIEAFMSKKHNLPGPRLQ